MNHVYASKIDISNFRAFGPNFSLSIPPGPGLVIVYGMNGLGKTTFFEAIEWLLTGHVRRIDDAKESRSPLANHLTRRGAEPKSHFVAATFGPDEKRISRSETENPSASELTDLLVSSEWTPKPDDISTYLRLTMFLPQARKFRFEEEKPKDQWQLLRGPAGVDQLDVMRRALGGLPTKNAFDKVADDLRAKVFVQKRALDDWKGHPDSFT
jgi:DNA repair exonuclease SbcCD ATPase subunit